MLILLLCSPESYILCRLWFRLLIWNSGSRGSYSSDCGLCCDSLSASTVDRAPHSLRMVLLFGAPCSVVSSGCQHQGRRNVLQCTKQQLGLSCCFATFSPCSRGSWPVCWNDANFPCLDSFAKYGVEHLFLIRLDETQLTFIAKALQKRSCNFFFETLY